MLKYAKLDEKGLITYAPKPLIINGEKVWTNREDLHLEQGYYPVVNTERPEKEGYIYEVYYELVDNQIIKKWRECEIEEPVVDEYEQAFNIITKGE